MSDSYDPNGHERPFVVGCGTNHAKYVVISDLENFIDQRQAPAGESNKHSANKSFQNHRTRKRKPEDVQSAHGVPAKRLIRWKQKSRES